MNINNIKRPWQNKGYHGNRLNPDSFYQSPTWKRTRKAFIEYSTLLPDGREVSNRLCLECFKRGIIKPMHTVDHIVRIKDGGSRTAFSNLQSLCLRCHSIKSQKESLL